MLVSSDVVDLLLAAIVVACAAVLARVYASYRRPRSVRCPGTGRVVEVKLDAGLALATWLHETPLLHVAGCALWPDRADCPRGCVHSLEQGSLATPGGA